MLWFGISDAVIPVCDAPYHSVLHSWFAIWFASGGTDGSFLLQAMLHAAGKAGGVQAHLRYLERERVLAGVRVLSEVTG